MNKLYREYSNNQWKSRKEIEKEQFLQLINLLHHAYKNVPYYRKLFQKHKINVEKIRTKEDLLRIPTLTREEITKNQKELISKKCDVNKLQKGQSGGSTGQPINFYQDKMTLDSFKAVEMRFYNIMGIRIGERTVRIWGAPRDINRVKTIKGRLIEKINNRIFLDGFDLTEKTMGKYVRIIRKANPKLIMGYVQCIDLLAQYLKKHKIRGIRPKAVFTTSSVLYPQIRKRIESAIGCEVFNEYGSCEFGSVGHECKEHKGLHINTETAFIEFIKDEKIAKPGEEAELVITTLTNYSMPLIRYKVGDVGSFTDRNCKCGRGLPLIENLLGRTFAVFTAIDGRKIHGYYFTNRVFMQMKNIKQFQMIQKNKIDYVVKIVKNSRFGREDIKFIEQKLKEKLGEEINIKYEYPKKINSEKSGKYLYTKSYVNEGC